MITYVFPGQGAQVKGMGGTLFDEFQKLTRKADEILGYSIKTLCLEDPNQQLMLTQYTQPALYVVNTLMYYKKIKESGQTPDFLAGHSLGEYNAILAAGGFDFETGLQLVKERGRLMSRSGGQGMAAVVGLKKEQVKEILQRYDLTAIDIANYNTAVQIVISGYEQDIERAKAIFIKEGASYIKLKVSAAFHSRYMQEAKEDFEEFLKNFSFFPLTIPVISNVTARPYEADAIAYNLANQLRSSVRWDDSIHYLMQQGEMEFEEIGSGRVLTKMIKKIQAEPVADCDNRNNDTNQKVSEWNLKHPIGTKVTCPGYPGELTTRTEAMVLFGHRMAVYMEHYNGYFDLEEITLL